MAQETLHPVDIVSPEALTSKILRYNRGADIEVVRRAYEYSEEVHSGQKRKSGHDYVTHPIAVADIIADMRLDVPSVVTGLLHDTVEDTLVTVDRIGELFGSEVAELVDGVTKISALEEESRASAEAKSVRKMLLASAKDIRVLLVKLADRVHNLRTIKHLAPETQRRICRQTLDLYVPFAHRLGIYWLKSEFEEVCFRILHPDHLKEIEERLELRRVQREGYIREICTMMESRLRGAGVDARVVGRPKSAYSIFRKMEEQGLRYDDIYDVVGFRALVDTESECYEALGHVHSSWAPVPGRFRDYVALPKANHYQSLHTTVIGPYGERLEVQIRTREMNKIAEFGVAAHWRYKTGRPGGTDKERFEWLEQILEWQQHLNDAERYIDTIKQDLFTDDVVVFTPRGLPKRLPVGSTVVDFAYRIHSDIGDHCAGGRVNGQLVPLRYQLKSGETVEVVTTNDQTPSKEWLKFVRTQRARERILSWIRHEEKGKSIALGRELIERDLSRHRLDLSRLHREGKMPDLIKHFACDDEDALFESLGYGRLTTRKVMEYLVPDSQPEQPRARRGVRALLSLLERDSRGKGRSSAPVTVSTTDDAVVRFARCCRPLAGEPIVGFMTRGRGVTVHAQDCERLVGTDEGRHVDVGWEEGARAPTVVKLEVVSRDRTGLLAAMSHAIASAGVNIDRAYVRTTGANTALNVFDITLLCVDDLERVSENLRRVAGVRDVRRIRA